MSKESRERSDERSIFALVEKRRLELEFGLEDAEL